MKRILLMLVAVMFSFPCHASNFRTADQIRLLSSIHISPWVTDAWITNESDDPVNISITYGAANGPANKITKRDVIKLAPRQHCEFIDILGAATSPSSQCKLIGAPLTTSGFGQIVFNACLDGANCEWEHTDADGYYDPPASITQNYRNISVSSRIYSTLATSLVGACPNGCPTLPTVGQDFVGLPWWDSGDFKHPLTITGIRASSLFHTNFGLVNSSDINTIVLTVTLFDGATHTQRDKVDITLGPFRAQQQRITELFPLLGAWNRANRTRAATNAYITVTTKDVNGGFFAYGSLIDEQSGDPTTLEAIFTTPLTDIQIANLFDGTLQSADIRSLSKGLTVLSVPVVALPPCSTVGPMKDGSYEAFIRKEGQMVPYVTSISAKEADVFRVDCNNAALGFGKSDLIPLGR